MAFRDFLEQHQLPVDYLQQAAIWFDPHIEKLALQHSQDSVRVVGINGCQGSGKSTLAAYICCVLGEKYGLNGVALSIDDFYLTRAEREQIATDVHPLLITRGVPGTHDIALALTTITHLLENPGKVSIPRFDKAMDDRARPMHWDQLNQHTDIVILEGWCVGVPSQPANKLKCPINALEEKEDPDGSWRHAVNEHLSGEYKQLFAMLDQLWLLAAPSFDCVFNWRQEQELKMLAKRTGPATQAMDTKSLKRFIQHYQRLTEHSLETLPKLADVVFYLDEKRRITRARQR